MRVAIKWLVCLLGLTLAVCVLATSNRIAFDFQTPRIPQLLAKHFARSASGQSRVRDSSDLLIDPVLVYSTFLGGPNGSKLIDEVTTLVVDGTGNVYVAGNTSSVKFPTTAGVVLPTIPPNSGAAFVAKIDPTGKTLLFSTYVPGILQIEGMALDPSGNIYLAGIPSDVSLPIPAGTTPFQGARRSIGIVKLNSSATAILNATYLGGSGNNTVGETAFGIAADSAGSLYVAGITYSNDFPTTSNALQTSLGTMGNDAFFTKLNSNLSNSVYSTYLGANGRVATSAGSIAIDSSMNAYIASAATPGFPITPDAAKATCSTVCAYLAKLNPSASGSASLVYSTFLGEDSGAQVIKVDSNKNAYIGGLTTSHISPLDSCTSSNNTGFVAEIDAAGTLPFSTCIGNLVEAPNEGVTALVLDASGILYIAGSADGLALKNPIQTNAGPGINSYVAAINPSTNSLLFSTLIGGAQPLEQNRVTSVGVDSSGNIYAAGGAWGASLSASTPPPLPVFNALQPVPGAGIFCTECAKSDAFIWKIAPTDAPAAALTPAQLTFPAQAIGTSSSAQTVTIVDLGSATLNISNAAITGDFSVQNNCSTVTPAGGTCTINVTFTPTTAGTQTGVLTITDNSAGSPHTVQLLAVGGQGSAQFSPASLSFGNQVVATTSAVQQVKLSNSGTLPLNVSHIQAASPFSETNDCGTSVGAGGSCTISVTFAPTAAGSATGALMFTDSASDSPQTVPLSGEGTAPVLGLGVASGSSNSAQVKAGSSATYVLSIGGGGTSGTASLTCTGAPANAICSVPATVAVNAGSATNFNVSVSTTAPSQLLVYPFSLRPLQWLWAVAIFGVMFVFRLNRQFHVRRLVWAVPLMALILCSCGGGGVGSTGTGTGTTPTPPSGGTAAGTYTVTVTAKLGSATQTQTLTLVVQ
jgi:hypothetical protein